MKQLIEKYEIKAKVLLSVIQHPDTDEVQIEKAEACRRIVMEVLSDLKQQDYE